MVRASWIGISSYDFALAWGWYAYDGDISYGRLTRIPYQEIQWYHAVAPAILLLLTRIGIPVSTTFLVLSAFASTVVLEKMLLKSVVGYGLAAMVAYICLLYTSPSPRDPKTSRMPSSA